MSMILDALKRADRERRRQEVELPTLNTEHAIPTQAKPEQPSRQARTTLIIAGVLLTLSTLTTLTLTSVRAPQPELEQPLPESGEQARPEVPPANSSARERQPQQPEASSSATGSPSEIAQLYQRGPEQAEPQRDAAPEPDVAKLYNPEVSAEPAHVSLPPPRSSAEVRLGAEEQAPPPEPTPEETLAHEAAPAQETAPTQEPAPETANNNAQVALAPTPSIRDLPWALQQNIPSITYQRHNYRDSGQHSVVLNQKEWRPGQQVMPEIVIEEIKADGVVLNYRGEKFKLRALNSWVNM